MAFDDILGNENKYIKDLKNEKVEKIIKILTTIKGDLKLLKDRMTDENSFMELCKKIYDDKEQAIEEVIDPNMKEIDELIDLLEKEDI